MKRGRGGMEESEMRSAIEELSLVVKDKPSDKIGPTMAVLRQDIHQNIQKLDKMYESDPSVYSNVVEILKKEAREGIARKPSSCSRALVWLTRSMDFTVNLLEKLEKDVAQSLEQVVEDAYITTLKPWHGWISSAAYKVALKLIPERKAFIKLLIAEEEDYDMLKEEMRELISLLLPLLDDIHSILRSFHLDKLKAK
ncbi:PREDICTED: glycolipid transfer protein 3-like isoform X2 [Nelumbo nucifera]|uniref:Glycolipid transfer protein 3-like isoform X2 n=1 Tax=Nelumbo nucifera TaxID=4432 RepID=A0A1U7YUG1_NELNU|nr:PREDICTED: glycolipid transfer protein 3-like isoform X2 [Nelumbo nucifera]